jgi:hypothetical protein
VVGAVVVNPQGARDPAAAIAAQREAMGKFAGLDGKWRGPAWTVLPSGEKHEIIQTERCGPFLDGSVRVIEGRGYEADGKTGFNALAILSFDADKKTYSMHSHAQGRVGDFVVTPAADGFSWEIAAGPMTIRYTATVKGDSWHEVGDRIAPGKEPVRFFEMTLQRIGDTNWPAVDPVGMK